MHIKSAYSTEHPGNPEYPEHPEYPEYPENPENPENPEYPPPGPLILKCAASEELPQQ